MFEDDPPINNTTTERFLHFKLIERFDLNFRVTFPSQSSKLSALCHANRHVDWYL